MKLILGDRRTLIKQGIVFGLAIALFASRAPLPSSSPSAQAAAI